MTVSSSVAHAPSCPRQRHMLGPSPPGPPSRTTRPVHGGRVYRVGPGAPDPQLSHGASVHAGKGASGYQAPYGVCSLGLRKNHTERSPEAGRRCDSSSHLLGRKTRLGFPSWEARGQKGSSVSVSWRWGGTRGPLTRDRKPEPHTPGPLPPSTSQAAILPRSDPPSTPQRCSPGVGPCPPVPVCARLAQWPQRPGQAAMQERTGLRHVWCSVQMSPGLPRSRRLRALTARGLVTLGLHEDVFIDKKKHSVACGAATCTSEHPRVRAGRAF